MNMCVKLTAPTTAYIIKFKINGGNTMNIIFYFCQAGYILPSLCKQLHT